MIFSHLVDFLIKKYYWRSTLIILSGIVLVCAILGTLFRPLITTQQIDATEREHSDNCLSLFQFATIYYKQVWNCFYFSGETDDFCDIKSKRNGNCKQKSRANSLSTLSTDDEATNSNDTQYTSTQSLLTHSSESCKHENTSLTHAGEQWRNEIFSRWSLSYQVWTSFNSKSANYYWIINYILIEFRLKSIRFSFRTIAKVVHFMTVNHAVLVNMAQLILIIRR